MKRNNQHELGAPILLLVSALFLTLVPLPESLRPFRPHWISLVLLYLAIYAPLQTGILRSWFFGILTDALTGTLFGTHALTYAATTFIGLRFHLQLRVFVVLQQMITVALITLLNLLIIYLIRTITTGAPDTLGFWAPLLTTPLLWPVLYLLADRHFHPQPK